jgi:hypothetical protein
LASLAYRCHVDHVAHFDRMSRGFSLRRLAYGDGDGDGDSDGDSEGDGDGDSDGDSEGDGDDDSHSLARIGSTPRST